MLTVRRRRKTKQTLGESEHFMIALLMRCAMNANVHACVDIVI